MLANSDKKVNISAHNGGPEQNGFSALVVTPKRRSCLFLFLSQRRHNHDLSQESLLFFFKTGSKRAQFRDHRNVDTKKKREVTEKLPFSRYPLSLRISATRFSVKKGRKMEGSPGKKRLLREGFLFFFHVQMLRKEGCVRLRLFCFLSSFSVATFAVKKEGGGEEQAKSLLKGAFSSQERFWRKHFCFPLNCETKTDRIFQNLTIAPAAV